MKKSLNALCFWVAPVLVPWLPGTVFVSSANAQAASSPSTILADVVVTTPSTSDGQVTAMQSVPVPATILTQHQLESQQITNLLQAQRLEPSLMIKYTNFRNLAINIRGFGASSSNGTDGLFSGVPIYVDGVYLPRPGQAILDVPDLVGIEVLKGPQGTSGGMDSTGGVINLSTALPRFTPESKIEFSYGSFNFVEVKASTTGPIAGSDKAAFRIAGFSVDRNGYVGSFSSAQNFNDWHDKGVRAQILLTPTEQLTARLIGDYSHVNQACCVYLFNGAVTARVDGTAITNNFWDRAARIGYRPPSTDALANYKADIAGYQNYAQDSYGASAAVTYRLNGFTFSSLTAFRGTGSLPNNLNNGIIASDINTNMGAYITEKSVEQEFKISTPQDQPVEATAGLFYFWEQLNNHGITSYGSTAGPWFGSTAPSASLLNNTALNYTTRNYYDNPNANVIAPYGRAVWHVTPQFDMTAGLRYSYTVKSAFYQQWQTGGADVSGLSATQQATVQSLRDSLLGRNMSYSATTRDSLVSALMTASYKFTPDALGYVTYSRGGRAGGIVLANLPVGVPNTVKPEEINNYEVGLKSAFFDQRLTANLAAFVMADRNYITTVVGPIGATSQNFLANAKRAISRGVELDMRARPIDGLDLFASATYIDAFYSSFQNSACPFEQSNQPSCDFTGKPLSLTPKWAFAIGGEYSHNLGVFLPYIAKPVIGYLGGNFSYQTKFFSTPDDSIYSIINAYGLLDLHAGLKLEDESVDLSVWAHNVLDKHYFTQLTPVTAISAGAIGGVVGDPFMAGFTLRVRI